MAKSKKDPLGGFRGRIGNLVVYEMYGKPCVRSMPAKTSKKASEKLKKEQEGFATVMHYLTPATKFIQMGFAEAAENTAPFHMAKSWNINNYRKSQTKDPSEWLQYSLGERAGSQGMQLKEVPGQLLEVSWGQPEEGKPCAENDIVMLLTINSKSKTASYRLHAACRKDGQAVIELPERRSGEAVEVFVAFRKLGAEQGKKDLKNVSNSQWVGRV